MSGTAQAENYLGATPLCDLGGDLVTRPDLRTVGPEFSPTRFAPTRYRARPEPATKRQLDIALALMFAVGAIPLGLLIAAAIKLTSRGPIFYFQKRVGRDGEAFEIVKFRTMRPGTDQEVMCNPLERRTYEANGFKMREDDPRITAIGRFLRKSSLDELPQLINVLRGEMSLVGIRPLLAEELSCRPRYDQNCYMLFPPGMTGLWQVSGRSRVKLEQRLTLDRRYAEEWSLLGDLRILLRTPSAVLATRNAQ